MKERERKNPVNAFIVDPTPAGQEPEAPKGKNKRKKLRVLVAVLIIIGVLALAAAGVLLWFHFDNTFTIELTVLGDAEITLEYGSLYEDEGAFAICYGKHYHKEPVPVKVWVQNKLDSNKVGTYEICYNAVYCGASASGTRTVKVIDTKKPTITLLSDPEKYTLPGHPYEEEGFTAQDEHDGDLTDKVQREEKDGMVTYTVSDSSGNTFSITREVVYNDPNPPELTLKGDSYITIRVGEKFGEPGYQAIDDCQGDITAAVQVSNSVDPYKPGSYVLTYTVEDDFGNKSTATRTVVVLDLDKGSIAEPNGKTIYLTFDDGPGPYTAQLLDVLKKYNVKVTFFVVNTGNIELIRREAEEGHTVAIHTKTHRFQDMYKSDQAFFDDLYGMQAIIKEHTGQTAMIMRFPGGSSNTISANYSKGIMSRLTKSVQEKGFRYFDWNVDSDDAGRASSAKAVFNNVVKGVSDHTNSVVLQHDIKKFSVEAVERIIIWGLTNGYRFQALSEDSPSCHHGVFN